jgi:hypothetical protein
MSEFDFTNIQPYVTRTEDPEKFAEAQARFVALLHDDRTPADPTDQWSHLDPPLDDERLATLRATGLEMDDYYSGGVLRERVELGGGYTCDTCSARFTCPLVFDDYNTDGDCLMSK